MFDIVLKGGPVGLLTLLISIAGVVLAICSIIGSCKSNKAKLPISLKLLFLCSLATLLIGAFGTCTGYVATFSALAAAGGDKVAVMEHGLEESRIVIQFALISALLQLFVIMISLFILNGKSKRLNIAALSLLSQFRKIPMLCYPIVILLFSVIVGIALAFWAIEYIVKTKPEEPMPVLLKMNFDYLFSVFMVCGVMGVILVLILLVQMMAKRVKT